jgi:BNR repeat protein
MLSRKWRRIPKSTDQGGSFSAPVKVSEDGKLALGSHRGPRVAIVSGAVVISAIVGEKGGGADGDLISWRSTDGGETWSTGSKVNDVPGSAREGLHGMASGGGDILYATWLDLRSKGTKLYGAVSIDGGANWSENRLVYESPSGTVCECCHPTVAVDRDGRIQVMFRNAVDGYRDMYLIGSTDGGKSFGKAQKLGEGTWKLEGCPMDGGSFAIGDDGRTVNVWRRQKELYRTQVSGAEELIGTGKNPVVALGKEGSYTAWTDSAGVRYLGPVQKEPATLDREGRYVQLLALPGGPVLAAWQSGGAVRAERLP